MSKKRNPRVVERFTGPGGNTKLLEALRYQTAVAGNLRAAKKLAKCAVLRDFRRNQEITTQGAGDIWSVLAA